MYPNFPFNNILEEELRKYTESFILDDSTFEDTEKGEYILLKEAKKDYDTFLSKASKETKEYKKLKNGTMF